MTKKSKSGLPPLDEFSFHEVLHTSSLIGHLFETSILHHRAVVVTPELASAAKKIHEQLLDFYGIVADVNLKKAEERARSGEVVAKT